ncbi:hypothetical protein GCM10009819_16490 [Agromyces tropicus]|uniref:DUF3558 domain-containing protein n=1 Tax=Agromyces tropicus TaxID=555371 RepID=A0ABN2UBI1_9MICO
MTRHLAPATISSAILLAALLSGCTPTGPADAALEPAGATSASPAPEPEATPTASAAAPAADATCDDLLTDAGAAALDEDGLALQSDPSALGAAMEDLLAHGAMGCRWAKPDSDIAVWVARLPEADDAWSSRHDALVAAGWSETGDPIAGTLIAPADYDANYRPSIVHADGATTFASSAAFLVSLDGMG